MHILSELASAARAWDRFETEDPKRHAEKLSQSSIILMVSEDLPRFYPLRHLWTWLEGVPFAQSGGRSLNASQLDLPLWEMGLAKVAKESTFFEPVFQRYVAACEKLGKVPSRVRGDDPRTDRVFWVTPGPFPPA